MINSAKRILSNNSFKLFFASLFALYLELIVIRWLASEIRAFAFLKNIPLIVSFMGLGLGIMSIKPKISLKKYLPYIIEILVIMLVVSPFIGLSDIPIPTADDLWIWWSSENFLDNLFRDSIVNLAVVSIQYALVVIFFLFLIFVLFFGIGELIRERLKPFSPLCAYSIDLLGSIVGVLLFTIISFLELSPLWWFSIGFFLFFIVIQIFNKKIILRVLLILVLLAVGTVGTYWSPYYRIEIKKYKENEQGDTARVILDVNHVYFQQMANHSDNYLLANPESALHQTAQNYNLPYRFIDNPGEALIVGAGTGNDVAAALRHNTISIDAVDIDPVIMRLGLQHHPENPYQDRRVTMIVDDARSFFEKKIKLYNTIVYGLLDSHTSASAMSNVRLDNYVYTMESFESAKKHLKEGGNIILSFAAGKPWIIYRLSTMLEKVFNIEPLIFKRAGGGDGAIFIVGKNLNLSALEDQNTQKLRIYPKAISKITIPTDNWPYLYLEKPSIPKLYSGTLLLVVFMFILMVYIFIGKKELRPFRFAKSEHWHFFLLGVGFLLIETKGINELAILFGSTWIVNSSVILGILIMAFIANSLIKKFKNIPLSIIIIGLFGSLTLGYVVRITDFSSAPYFLKFLVAGLFVAMPLFFSGLLFSSSFKKTNQIPEAFGANLFGAFFGGILENVSMITGIRELFFFSLFFYAAAVFLLPRIKNKIQGPAL